MNSSTRRIYDGRETRQSLIEKYKSGYGAVADALLGAREVELDARPAPAKWSAREIVHHLADSEMTSAIRLRLLLAEDRAEIRGYDQELFARTLHYARPIEASLEVFRRRAPVDGRVAGSDDRP